MSGDNATSYVSLKNKSTCIPTTESSAVGACTVCDYARTRATAVVYIKLISLPLQLTIIPTKTQIVQLHFHSNHSSNQNDMPTTEFAILPLVAGQSIGDPSHPSASILKETATTLHEQPGMQKIHFGSQIEHPDTLQMIVGSFTLHKYNIRIQHQTTRKSSISTPN